MKNITISRSGVCLTNERVKTDKKRKSTTTNRANQFSRISVDSD